MLVNRGHIFNQIIYQFVWYASSTKLQLHEPKVTWRCGESQERRPNNAACIQLTHWILRVLHGCSVWFGLECLRCGSLIPLEARYRQPSGSMQNTIHHIWTLIGCVELHRVHHIIACFCAGLWRKTWALTEPNQTSRRSQVGRQRKQRLPKPNLAERPNPKGPRLPRSPKDPDPRRPRPKSSHHPNPMLPLLLLAQTLALRARSLARVEYQCLNPLFPCSSQCSAQFNITQSYMVIIDDTL